jgi:endo-1,4-beta-xylanase
MRNKLLTAALGAALAVAGVAVPAALHAVTIAQAAAPGSLGALAAARGKYFGDAVDNVVNQEAADPQYRPIINTEFTSLTAGNGMKWDSTEPTLGQFNFSKGDEIVSIARANGQAVRGHTLVWHQQTPTQVQNLNATDLRAAMNRHITTVVTHYVGQLSAWDVVNEAFNDDGTMRQSFWLQKLGSTYIADAFRAARAADPNVKLYYNDFNIEGMGAKSNAVFTMAQSLKQQGLIDGVGFQTHLAVQFPFPTQFQQNLQRFADLGLDVAITELDVRMQLPADAAKVATQDTYYRNVVNACLAVTRCVGITEWGFTDKYSWIPGVFPGEGSAHLADGNFVNKSAYTVVRDALAGTPADTTPPTTPGTPAVSGVTSNSASLAWTASTDTGGSGLAGYNIYRRQGTTDTLLQQSTTPTVNLTGLTPSTQYVVVVRARDGAGNLSTASGAVTFTTLPGTGTGTCRVTYSAPNWGGGNGFTASITIANTGTTAINGWTLAFSYPSGQRLTPPGWGATWTQGQGSANVTGTNLDWNRTLNPNGGNTSIGFNGTFTGTNPAPTSFTLNGTTCTTT